MTKQKTHTVTLTVHFDAPVYRKTAIRQVKEALWSDRWESDYHEEEDEGWKKVRISIPK